MKKTYTQPNVRVYQIQPASMIADSNGKTFTYSSNGETATTTLNQTEATSEGMSRDQTSAWDNETED
jgi:hypothetical protein